LGNCQVRQMQKITKVSTHQQSSNREHQISTVRHRSNPESKSIGLQSGYGERAEIGLSLDGRVIAKCV
jgi:hypothetical protein